MKYARVSILINNYNYGRFLAQAVDSALNQDHGDTEVIVVDDGSTDESLSILRGYRPRVKLVSKANGGQASAFNSGFKEATGQIIGFLDADDILYRNAASTAANRLSESYAKLQFPLDIIDQEGVRAGAVMPRARLDRGLVEEKVLKTGVYITSPTSGNFYHRRFLEGALPIPEKGWEKGADSYINTLAALSGPIIALDTALGGYRIHGSNMTAVSLCDGISIDRIEMLLFQWLRQRDLIFNAARAREMRPSDDVIISHWLYLKLAIIHRRLSPRSPIDRRRTPSLLIAFAKSTNQSKELGPLAKVQALLWAIIVSGFPPSAARLAMEYALDPGVRGKTSQRASARRSTPN